jgi:hypothetical protein
MQRRQAGRIAGVAALLAVLWPSPAAFAAQPRFSAPQLRQDLAALGAAIRDTPPYPAHSIDTAALARAMDALERQLDRPMTRDEAWAVFATLNPLLADGHLFVGFEDWRGATEAHLESGGVLFPFELHVTPDLRVFVRSQLGGAASVYAGTRVRSINGVDAGVVSRTLLALVHGDTATFRADLLSRRWWFYYWKTYGAVAEFEVALDDPTRTSLHVPGSRHRPAILVAEASFDRQFGFASLPCDTALLTLRTFSWPDKAQFQRFTRDAFSKIRDDRVRRLIIDVRDNGGGDDDFWMHGILPYIATGPYRWGSTYRKRVLEAYRDEGETTGQVVTGAIDRWIPSEPTNPLHFPGTVYVLIGPATYSSAVLFANVMRDFGFGVLAGSGGSVRADQSGSVQQRILPNTGLVVWSPRFVLYRPSGASEPMLLEPDCPIEEDPFNAGAAVNRLLGRITGGACNAR